jgi:hypothetical protein
MEEYKYKELTDKNIQTFNSVYNELINYLKATDKEIGLLLNFGVKPVIRRKVFDNRKNLRKSFKSV